LLIGGYVVARYGLWPLISYIAGGAPAALLLGVYDELAFGSPFHLSYRYVTNQFTDAQRAGFFGIGEPTIHGVWLALGSERGLLVVSPVLLAALAGLVLMARRGLGLEAAVCMLTALLFLLVDASYFDPYGGSSPGPRFFAPALPFLALGLADAFRRWRYATALLALASIVLVSLDTLTWQGVATVDFPTLPLTIWTRLGLSSAAGVALELLAVAFTTLLAARALISVRAAAPPAARPAA